MEIIRILRNHLDDLTEKKQFENILDNVQSQFDENHRYDQEIVNCIDLEGLDGCGKSTLATALHRQLTELARSSRLLSTPPSELIPFRSHFDSQVESIRRAYYNLANLIISLEMKKQRDTITILDRYWPSTIAYQLARRNEFPQISWPEYLVRPSLIIYLYVDEAERCRRISQRSISVTLEEKQLANEEEFRRRLDQIYREKIPHDHLHVIDGNRATTKIVDEILTLLKV